MARNQKLTKLIQGRKIASVESAGSVLTIRFADGSTMTVQTGRTAPAASLVGETIQAVRQQDTKLSIDFEDGKTLEITTAEPTSSVMLRDKNGVLEYAD